MDFVELIATYLAVGRLGAILSPVPAIATGDAHDAINNMSSTGAGVPSSAQVPAAPTSAAPATNTTEPAAPAQSNAEGVARGRVDDSPDEQVEQDEEGDLEEQERGLDVRRPEQRH